jgi:SPP1 family predicted phage head-tail adaptor
MGKIFDRPIMIQKIDEDTEEWVDLFDKPIHASINKAKSDNEYLNAGAVQGKKSLVFEVRYFKDLEDIEFNTQLYRIIYQGVPYDIKGYDDFMLTHKTVKLLGVSY